MQAFTSLTLLTLLFITSGATGTTATTAPPTASTGATDTTATTAPPTASTGATDTTATTAPPTASTGATDTTATTAPPTASTGATDTTATTAPPTASTVATDTTAAAASPTAPAGAASSTAAAASPTAPAGAASSTAAAASRTTPAEVTKGPCLDGSCSGGSFCVGLNTKHFCLCVDGYYYNSSKCNKGKVFPGAIQVKVSDTSGLENEKSINYESLHIKVTKFFQDAFTDLDYGQTVIQKVRISASTRSVMQDGNKNVDVEVVNVFSEATKANEVTIGTAIQKAISNNPTGFANYTMQDRCEFYGCVKRNEQDDCSNGFQCKCQPGHERPNPQTAVCVPSSPKCPDTCNAEQNMQCLVKDKGNPDCVCLAGYKKDDRGKCQACAFGYQGVNCEDNFQLILTVVGTIAGIVILGMVIALIFVRSKKTKNIEEQNLIENDFQNLRLQHTTGFSSPVQGSIFPKITTVPRDGGMQNPYANPRGIPNPDY